MTCLWQADFNRRLIRLDGVILRIAYDREMSRQAGVAPEEQESTQLQSSRQRPLEPARFSGLPFPTRELAMLDPRGIDSFEKARALYLRAAAKLEAAKKHFPLDGELLLFLPPSSSLLALPLSLSVCLSLPLFSPFLNLSLSYLSLPTGFVTDHVSLLEEHSRLYHHLSVFEADLKRRTAMELKRAELLRPVLSDLNRSVYDVLHKQVAYELGEVYITLLDLLAEKYNAQGTTFAEIKMKAGDTAKAAEYCTAGISMFAHFADLYTKRPGPGTTASAPVANFQPITDIDRVCNAGCTDPDECKIEMRSALDVLCNSCFASALLNAEELRPFLNAHFHISRLLSKIGIPPAGSGDRARFLVASLKRYEWLVKAVPKYCALKQVTVEDTFKTELELCREMVVLLPTRIDRVHFLGRDS